MDPSPFLERDLDDDAVDYILSSAMEHGVSTDLKLVILLPESELTKLEKKEITEAIHNHFAYAVSLQLKKLKQIFKQGQFALLVGLVMLILSVSIASQFNINSANPILHAMKEGLIILGWVALWRPFDLFLYSWWPEVEKRKYFEKLSRISVDFKVAP